MRCTGTPKKIQIIIYKWIYQGLRCIFITNQLVISRYKFFKMKSIKLLIVLGLVVFSSRSFSQSSRVLDYIYSISGEKTIAGQHNKEPNAEPAMWTEYINETTGKYPGLWSGDFLFQQINIDNRWTMIHEAERQWNKGAIINLMWHGCPPDQGEPCGWDPGLLNAQLDDDQWKEITTDGTPLNQ